MTIAAVERLLAGPGPSPVSSRVMRAMATPVLGHLDPALLDTMDCLRSRIGRAFRAPDGSVALAVSGTGTAAMECAVANLVTPGTTAVAIVNGYFGERMAAMLELYGAAVTRVAGSWGRAIAPDAVVDAIVAHRPALVTVVDAETSTGVRNPVPDVARAARAHDALVLVDAVTSLGGMPVDVTAWGVDVCYTGGQKCLGAPSGLAPIVFAPRALERRIACRTFYLDLKLLDAYWTERKYHHTIPATLVYALDEALAELEEEGLERRWDRHALHHRALTAGLEALGLPLLPPPAERLWTLHTPQVPAGVDEGAVRRDLRELHSIEIGAGLGPLAGHVWRIGLMGTGSTAGTIVRLLSALDLVLRTHGHAEAPPGSGVGAALRVLAGEAPGRPSV